jgi:hypothetical protein
MRFQRLEKLPKNDTDKEIRLKGRVLCEAILVQNAYLASFFAIVAKSRSMRRLARPKSIIAEIVVTGVSAITETLVVFSSTRFASIRSAELHDTKPFWVFALM